MNNATPMTETETRRSSFRILGTCKVCRRAHTAIVSVVATYTSVAGRIPTRSVRESWPNAKECCGRHVALIAVKGRRTETPCDERCTEAIGHKCECSCGGRNHGAGHA